MYKTLLKYLLTFPKFKSKYCFLTVLFKFINNFPTNSFKDFQQTISHLMSLAALQILLLSSPVIIEFSAILKFIIMRMIVERTTESNVVSKYNLLPDCTLMKVHLEIVMILYVSSLFLKIQLFHCEQESAAQQWDTKVNYLWRQDSKS